MGTAQVDRPLLHRRESVYELLRLSLANQTYKGPIEVVVADAMTERLERELKESWGRAERVVLTQQVRHDRIAISAARNTAAVYARGDLLVFVDDATELLSNFVEAAVDVHATGKIPSCFLIMLDRRAPHINPTWREQQHPCSRGDGDLCTWPVVGHVGGVFVISREAFLKLNGFDENFDGNWGCEDQEFWARVDRAKLARVGRSDLGALRWKHRETPPRARVRRCRELYAQWSYRSTRLEANRRLSDGDLEQLRKMKSCGSSTCALCQAADRKQQIETYRTIPAEFDLRALHATYSARPSGVYVDPWR
jgi:glycosyltransferase involved in cell wall biosynthesis